VSKLEVGMQVRLVVYSFDDRVAMVGRIRRLGNSGVEVDVEPGNYIFKGPHFFLWRQLDELWPYQYPHPLD
jgi:hypothetical protein